jgi:NADH dehydrogenase
MLLAETRRHRLLLDIPFGIASLQARLMSLLPNAPLTPDQVELLKQDNVVSSGALTLDALGITPTPVEAILPTYLDRFRRGGWYARERTV